MSLNDTPSGERIHIGFFGRRNAGKSSVVNAVTGQDLAVVSQVEGTTTDPVKKAMELLPLGPVVIIDTPGFDDEGMLGELRVKKTRQILAQTDLAILVVDGTRGLCDCDRELLGLFEERKIPCIIANNKSDLLQEKTDGNVQAEKQLFSGDLQGTGKTLISVSAKTGDGIYALKEKIADIYREWKAGQGAEPRLVSDLLQKGDQVILVIPIDKAAPNPSPAASDPRYSGFPLQRALCAGGQCCQYTGQPAQSAGHGDHGQPGLCLCDEGRSREHSSHLFFHSDGPL